MITRCLLGIFIALFSAGAVVASDQQHDFDISENELASAINQLANQANARAIFPYERVSPYKSNKLHGRYTLQSALNELLNDTGLTGFITADGVITVIAPRHVSEHSEGKLRNTTLKRGLLGSASAILASVFTAPHALAQDDAAEAEADKIIVTGSRIVRDGFEALQPITVVDAAKFDARGATNIAEVLNEQAVFGTPGGSPIGDQTGATVGQNFANLFGLGAQRTLTLVNGQRFPAGISAAAGGGGLQVDLNAIPLALVERVETIAVGGAPIYGSDAIAGTVNVILKDDFEGIAYNGSFGINPEYGDSEEFRGSVVLGKNFNDGRTNVMASVDYSDLEGLRFTDRDIVAEGLAFSVDDFGNETLQTAPTVAITSLEGVPLFFADSFCLNTACFNNFTAGSVGLPFGFFDPNGIPLDINDPNSPLAGFDANGNLVPFVPGEGSDLFFRSGGDGFNITDQASLFTDLERFNANLIVNHEFNDRLRVRGEFWYGRNESQELINQPDFNSAAFGGIPGNSFSSVGSGPIPVVIDNPFIPAGTRATILSALNVVHDADGDGVADPTIDTDGDGIADAVGFAVDTGLGDLLGPNFSGAERDLYRAVLGFEGEADIAGRDYAWDISASYGLTQSRDIRVGINQPNFERAVQVLDDGTGNPTCADPSGGCVPLDIFGTPSAEAIDFVTDLIADENEIEQFVVSANIAGDLFDWRAGTIGGAFGTSFRREEASFTPNALDAVGDGRNGLIEPINGGFSSYELYGEIVVPVLGGDFTLPLVEKLDLEAAARFVHNSISGGDTTYTLGGRLGVFGGLEFRGNFTRSIRAPSITELFTPPTPLTDFSNDPCDASFINDGNVPERRAANCAAAGIVQPFTSVVVNASQLGTISGNQNLSVEAANSKTFGFVFRPDYVPGLSIAADWVEISIEDAIDSLTLQTAMQGCFDSASFPDEPLCALFTRDAAGQVIDFQVGFQNIDRIEFSGLQSVISYDIPMGGLPGELSVSGNYLFTDDNTVTRGSENPVQNVGFPGTPKHRFNLSSTYRIGKFSWFNQARYLSGTSFNDTQFSIGGWGVFDSSVSYDVHDNMTVQLAAENVFNREAPFLAQLSGSTLQTHFSGIQGRYLTFSVRGQF